MNRKLDGRLFSKPALALCLFEEGWSLHLLGLFIPLRMAWREMHRDSIMETWGISFHDRTIHMNWGHRCKIIYLPWMWQMHKHEVRRSDGRWAPYVGSWEHDKEPDGREEQKFVYHYRLRRGEVQARTATVYVDRYVHRWHWFKWLPWPRRTRQYIEVQFSGEVGEETGSWKGGCVGCGYAMLPGETPEQTLRRMESERKF